MLKKNRSFFASEIIVFLFCVMLGPVSGLAMTHQSNKATTAEIAKLQIELASLQKAKLHTQLTDLQKQLAIAKAKENAEILGSTRTKSSETNDSTTNSTVTSNSGVLEDVKKEYGDDILPFYANRTLPDHGVVQATGTCSYKDKRDFVLAAIQLKAKWDTVKNPGSGVWPIIKNTIGWGDAVQNLPDKAVEKLPNTLKQGIKAYDLQPVATVPMIEKVLLKIGMGATVVGKVSLTAAKALPIYRAAQMIESGGELALGVTLYYVDGGKTFSDDPEKLYPKATTENVVFRLMRKCDANHLVSDSVILLNINPFALKPENNDKNEVYSIIYKEDPGFLDKLAKWAGSKE